MKLHRINLLKRLNGSFLFVFFILFTVPIEADDFISESVENDRRRMAIAHVENHGADPVTVSQQLSLHSKPVAVLTRTAEIPFDSNQYESNFENVAPEQGQFALGYRSRAANGFAEPPQQSILQRISNELELKSRYSQWMGTAVSETGPPLLSEIVHSFLPGNEFLSTPPRVIKTAIPNQYLKQVSHEIDQKILSVRAPTGPPAYALTNIDRQDIPGGPGYTFLNSSTTPIHQNTFCESRDLPRGIAVCPSAGSG